MKVVSSYSPHTSCFNSIQEASNAALKKIHGVASSTLTELGAALALNLTFNLCFGILILPPTAHLMTGVCGLALIGMGAYKVVQVWRNTFHITPEGKDSIFLQLGTTVENGVRSLARLSIVNTTFMKVTIGLHELGHAGAALLCFIQADPKIIVRWYEGLTEYNISYGLTAFGEWLGEQYVFLFTTAAGPISTVLFATTEIVMAHSLKDHHPIISEILNYHGVSQILNLTIYGFSAFISSKSSLINDFIFLWVRGGIHPLIPIGLFIAVPVCTWLALNYSSITVIHQVTQS